MAWSLPEVPCCFMASSLSKKDKQSQCETDVQCSTELPASNPFYRSWTEELSEDPHESWTSLVPQEIQSQIARGEET